MSRGRALLALSIVLWSASILRGWPQGRPAGDSAGILFGIVKDAGGSPLPGVTVTVIGPAPAQSRSVVTDSAGSYLVPALPPGTYSVAFVLAGYFPLARDSVVIVAGARFGLNVLLGANGTAAGAPRARSADVLVRLETPLGNIDLAIDVVHAPVTSANFLKYVDGGIYDGGRFHRVTRADNYTPAPPDRPMMEIVQAGTDPRRERETLPPIPLERTSVTGLRHVAGAVSMARSPSADSATSDFFILLNDQPSLDFGGRRFDDGQGAAAFGRVVAGLDVVRKIQQQPVDADPQKRQNLSPPVPILHAARVK